MRHAHDCFDAIKVYAAAIAAAAASPKPSSTYDSSHAEKTTFFSFRFFFRSSRVFGFAVSLAHCRLRSVDLYKLSVCVCEFVVLFFSFL